MKSRVFRLLEPEEVERIVRRLAQETFVDGRVTAVGQAPGLKKNLQVDRSAGERREIDDIVVSAVSRNEDLQIFALPTRYVMPVYSRYEPGMKYGNHVDNSLMGGMNGVRTDLAMTVFLSPPASYDGGELTIEDGDEVKLDAGEAYVYSASTIHRVQPVTRGVRLAVVTWLQSAVRDETLRGILADIAKAAKKAQQIADHEHELSLSKIYHNLIRYAAQP
jgi:PKHD-type hydroxylase